MTDFHIKTKTGGEWTLAELRQHSYKFYGLPNHMASALLDALEAAIKERDEARETIAKLVEIERRHLARQLKEPHYQRETCNEN